MLSAGAFYKRLSNPIFLFTEENDLGGATSQPRNVESAEIRGVEVAVQQQLSMLPRPLDGLGIWANYTYTDSEATLPGGRTRGSPVRPRTSSIPRSATRRAVSPARSA